MLDPQLLRTDPDAVAARLAARGYEFNADAWRDMDARRKELQVRTQELQNRKNQSAKSIGEAKRRGEDIQPLLDEILITPDPAAQIELANEIDTSGIEPVTADAVANGLPENTEENADAYVDALVARCIELHGEEGFSKIRQQSLESIRDEIREDLEEFGVHYDAWFSERSLTGNGSVQRAIERLKLSGHVYEKGGAQWFRSTDFGDEKDRVIVRENQGRSMVVEC